MAVPPSQGAALNMTASAHTMHGGFWLLEGSFGHPAVTSHTPFINSSTSARIPNSPWMPFSVLFASFSNKIPPKNMELVKSNYDLFTNKKISQDEFLKKLRLIVCDALLKSSILNLQSKLSPKPKTETVVPTQELENEQGL